MQRPPLQHVTTWGLWLNGHECVFKGGEAYRGHRPGGGAVAPGMKITMRTV